MSEVADGVWVTRVDAENYEPDEETGAWVHMLRADASVEAGLWRPPGVPGEEVPFVFAHHETIVVLAGSVEITTEGGPTLKLHVGDMASFRKGLQSVWRPSTDFREAWVYAIEPAKEIP